MNSIDLASLLLTDQHLSQNVSDWGPTQRERKQRRQEMLMRGSWKGLLEESIPDVYLCVPYQPYNLHWLSAWKYTCVCGLTYGLNHCHPAHPLCSCRMGTFVWRWNSFYVCHRMTVKGKKAWEQTGISVTFMHTKQLLAESGTSRSSHGENWMYLFLPDCFHSTIILELIKCTFLIQVGYSCLTSSL